MLWVVSWCGTRLMRIFIKISWNRKECKEKQIHAFLNDICMKWTKICLDRNWKRVISFCYIDNLFCPSAFPKFWSQKTNLVISSRVSNVSVLYTKWICYFKLKGSRILILFSSVLCKFNFYQWDIKKRSWFTKSTNISLCIL